MTICHVDRTIDGNVTVTQTFDVGGTINGVNAVFSNNVTGDLIGNVTGDLVGNVTGDLVGNVTGNLVGGVTGDLVGNVTGNLVGGVTGTVSSLSNHTTDDLVEGLTNKYYSDTLVDNRVKTNLGVAGLNNTQTSFTQPQVGTIDVNLHPLSQINGEDIQVSPIVEIEVVIGTPLKVFVVNEKVFKLNGRHQADLNLLEGYTYRFDQSDSSNTGSSTVDNTIRFWETLYGTEYTSSLLTYGKYSNGTVIPPGNAGAYTQLKITSATPRTLYYYASNTWVSRVKNTDSDRVHLAGDQKFTIGKGGDVISTSAVVNPKIAVDNPFFSGDVRIDGDLHIDGQIKYGIDVYGPAYFSGLMNVGYELTVNTAKIGEISSGATPGAFFVTKITITIMIML